MCDHHANCQPHGNSNGDGYAATNANAQVDASGKAAPHASSQALDFALPEISGDRSPVYVIDGLWSLVGARSDAPYLHTRTRADLGRAGSPLHADFHCALPPPD